MRRRTQLADIRHALLSPAMDLSSAATLEYLADRLLNRGHGAEKVQSLLDALSDRPGAFDVEGRAKSRVTEAAVAAELPAGVEQRTPEWYAAREKIITASDFGDAMGESTRAGFVRRKVLGSKFTGSTATQWGAKYEDVACQLYQHYNGVAVREHGLLMHPTVSYLGASPDGVTDTGVMVEIKCPYTRTLDGDVPPKYYAQIQGQLEVCRLRACDFVVCRLREFDTFDAFLAALEASPAPERFGAVFSSAVSPAFSSADGLLAWIASTPAPDGSATYHEVVDFRVRRVFRDAEYWRDASAKLAAAWRDVETARETGSIAKPDPDSHRVPVLPAFSFRNCGH